MKDMSACKKNRRKEEESQRMDKRRKRRSRSRRKDTNLYVVCVKANKSNTWRQRPRNPFSMEGKSFFKGF